MKYHFLSAHIPYMLLLHTHTHTPKELESEIDILLLDSGGLMKYPPFGLSLNCVI